MTTTGEVRTQGPTPASMLQSAIDKGVDMVQLQALMDLRERWEAGEARKAYVAAMAQFKLDPPRIFKDKQVAFLDVKYKHAELDQVAEKIGAALAKVGIAVAWETDQSVQGQIKVTCILTHELGHSERVWLSGPHDASGKKNPLQAIGSTVSYLERYTILAATGLATGEDDNDGRPPVDDGGVDFTMPEAVFQGHLAEIETAKDVEELKKVYFKGFNAVDERDKKTAEALTKAKNARYRVLQAGGAK